MGRFSITFEVANDVDVMKAEEGLITTGKVRKFKIKGVVDSGASRLVLPQSVVKRLGLPAKEKVKVRYADRRTATRDTVERVRVGIMGRHGTFTAVVEPRRRTALIGAIILEDLDFLVDNKLQQLVPRDPKMVVSEIE